MTNKDLISRDAVMNLIQSKLADGVIEINDETIVDGYELLDEISDLPSVYDVQAVKETLEAVRSLAEKHAKKMSMEVVASEKTPWLKNRVYLKAVGTHELERIIMSVQEQAEVAMKIPSMSEKIHEEFLVKGNETVSFTLGNKKELVADVIYEEDEEIYLCFTVRDINSLEEYATKKIDYASSVDNIRSALEDFLLYRDNHSVEEKNQDALEDDFMENERG